MILSKSANYAVRAALYLSESAGDGPVPVDEMAEQLDVPRNYLSKVLHELARTDILESTRGPGGGFRLARPAEEVALSDIVRVYDEVPDETTCLLGRSACSDVDPCRAHDRWARVRSQLIDFLADTRLADLAGRPPDALRMTTPDP
ncbi:MAG: Rrf2 family transcriptional regulator [Gemmatimonadetes bacterium]|nr:Rrf2 family transcriptional regulator [Gemmatimonadota bacterium]NNF12448.1 Rrf2 family transcriptional regulator [Gemmatimonadota bacterium]NNL30272.1 Rrf2 family transcriptional regulator [Gemmatimonadota bacterium]